MDKEHILLEIKRTARENGHKPLGTARFEKETGIRKSDWWGKYWTGWNEAIEEAGYAPNVMQPAYDNDLLMQKIVELIQEIGHFPTMSERRLKAFQDKAFPSHNTFDRFGKKRDFVLAVLEYCETHDVAETVVEACRAAAWNSNSCEPQETAADTPVDAEEFDFVYLMKSGKQQDR